MQCSAGDRQALDSVRRSTDRHPMSPAEEYDARRQEQQGYVEGLLQLLRDGKASQRQACRYLDEVNRNLREIRSWVIRDISELQVAYRNARAEVSRDSHAILSGFFGAHAASRRRAEDRLAIAQEKDAVMGPYQRTKADINALISRVKSYKETIAMGNMPPAPED